MPAALSAIFTLFCIVFSEYKTNRILGLSARLRGSLLSLSIHFNIQIIMLVSCACGAKRVIH